MCKSPVAGRSTGHFKELKEASVAGTEKTGEGSGMGGATRVLEIGGKWNGRQSPSLELCSDQNELSGRVREGK